LFDVSNLRRCVFWRTIEHGDRDHRGQSARVATAVEEIESYLLVLGRAEIRWLMPGIDRGTKRGRLVLIRRVPRRVVEPCPIRGADIKFTDRIAHAVAGIGGAMRVTRIGRLGHPDAYEPHRHG